MTEFEDIDKVSEEKAWDLLESDIMKEMVEKLGVYIVYCVLQAAKSKKPKSIEERIELFTDMVPLDLIYRKCIERFREVDGAKKTVDAILKSDNTAAGVAKKS